MRWIVAKFDTLLKVEREVSQNFKLYGFQWRLILCPNGQKESPKHISVYVEFMDAQNAVNWELEVEFNFKIYNQKNENQIYQLGQWENNYCSLKKILSANKKNLFGQTSPRGGYPEFMLITEFRDVDFGWIVDNKTMIEMEICGVEVVKDPSS